MNNREKSNKQKGGQKGHKGTTLTQEEIDKMIENGEIEEVIEIVENKTEFNQNLKTNYRYSSDGKSQKKVKKLKNNSISNPKKFML